MTGSDVALELRRILVALDASPDSLAALAAAADLARRMEAELIGLFVEDEGLLSLADVPCAREILYLSAKEVPVDRPGMERKLRSQSQAARTALEHAAAQAKVPWSFRIARGDVAAQLMAAAEEADLVALGKVGWSIGPQIRIGSTAMEFALGSIPLLLSSSKGIPPGQPHVCVYYDGSAAAKRAVQLALRLATTDGGTVRVLMDAIDDQAAQSIQDEVGKLCAGTGIEAQFRRLDLANETDVAKVLGLAPEAIVVVGGKDPFKRFPWLDGILRSRGVRLLLLQDGAETQDQPS